MNRRRAALAALAAVVTVTTPLLNACDLVEARHNEVTRVIPQSDGRKQLVVYQRNAEPLLRVVPASSPCVRTSTWPDCQRASGSDRG